MRRGNATPPTHVPVEYTAGKVLADFAVCDC